MGWSTLRSWQAVKPCRSRIRSDRWGHIWGGVRPWCPAPEIITKGQRESCSQARGLSAWLILTRVQQWLTFTCWTHGLLKNSPHTAWRCVSEALYYFANTARHGREVSQCLVFVGTFFECRRMEPQTKMTLISVCPAFDVDRCFGSEREQQVGSKVTRCALLPSCGLALVADVEARRIPSRLQLLRETRDDCGALM
jgi:hypothetical protein